ncbi:hypothetical protein HYN69_07000 [Gemmobacter aquarius]|uniref:Phage integrase family protein n=2 Tax=Paragemmobacter aquarius TaxID=2169400 RepID=A0A2S0UKF8_9RHOB|nr:hypothetical protein HYN69_07000 [Gemmobacter aquarius]
MRDQRLKRYDRLWTEMRLKNGKDVIGSFTAHESQTPDQIEATIDHLATQLDDMAMKRSAGGHFDDLDDAREEVIESVEGAALWRKIQVLRGDLTPLAPLCEAWLATKGKKSAKTLSDYRLALRLLVDEFPHRESVTWAKARNFLARLMGEKAKGTVEKYTIAYKGVWEHNGWATEASMWSVKNMDSAIPTLKVRSYTDDQFVKLMDGIRAKGKRKLWLAVKIAAYSGASLSGIVGMELRDWDTDRPSLFLPETKKEWRSRSIPCHPAIIADVEEWVGGRLANQTITNQFSEMKTELGFGKEHHFHSFRHSVANRLENARVSSREVKRLMGHLIGNITFDTYSAEGLGYEVLNEVVRAIRWPEVTY